MFFVIVIFYRRFGYTFYRCISCCDSVWLSVTRCSSVCVIVGQVWARCCLVWLSVAWCGSGRKMI